MGEIVKVILFLLLIVGILATPAGCGMMVEEDIAIRALETHGFSNVKIIDKDVWFVGFKGGGKEDVVRFTAIATNPAGKEVEVYVFAGWPWKSATIRTR